MGDHAVRQKQGQLERLCDTPRLRLRTAGNNQASAPHTATTMCLNCPGVEIDSLPSARNAHTHSMTYDELKGAAHMWGVNVAQALQLS